MLGEQINKTIRKILIAISFVFPLLGFFLIRFRFSIIPMILSWFSPDGKIKEKTIQHFADLVSSHRLPIILFSLIPLLLLLGGRILSRILPEKSLMEQASPESPMEKKEWGFILLILLVALIIRIPAYFYSLDDDEIAAVVRFIKTPFLIQTLTTFKLHNHIGYSLIARFCYVLLGDAEWVFRLPSLLMGIGTIYQIWRIGRKYLDRNIAITAALFLAVLPFHVQYSTKARGYASMAFLMLISTRYFLELLRKKDFSKSLLFVFSSVAGIYFHLCGIFPFSVELFFFLVIVLQVIFTKSKSWSDRTCLINLWYCFAAIFLLSLLLYSPVFLRVVGTMESHGRGPIGVDFPVFVLIRFFGSIPLGIMNLMLLISGMVLVFDRQKLLAYYMLSLILIPFLLLWLISPADLVARFLFFDIPYVCLLSAAGVFFLFSLLKEKAPNSRFVRVALMAAVTMMICLQAKASWSHTPQFAFREAVKIMNANPSPQTAVCATGYAAEYYQYYSSTPIRVLKTKKEFDDLLPQFKEVRCAYIFTDWQATDQELISFLKDHARLQRTPGIMIFTYEPNETDR